MEVLELPRAGLGFGRVVVDRHGVTRRGPLSSASLAWHEVDDYRLTIQLVGVARPWISLDDVALAIAAATDAVGAYRGRDRFRYRLDLLGADRRVRIDWRFLGAEQAIAAILGRLRRPLGDRAREAFGAGGVGRFGPLAIADHGIAWRGGPPVPRARVDAIDLFDSSPIRLRVMALGKALPHGAAPLAGIPNLAAALDLARALGSRVRGRELLAPLGLA